MKYYSTILNKMFDTVKELEEAEKEHKSIPTAEYLNSQIKLAEEELEAARKNYTASQDSISKLSAEYLAKIDEITKAATEKINAAKRKRKSLIAEYNKYYGACKSCYKDEQVKKNTDYIDDILDILFH